MKRLAGEGRAVVYSSHYLPEIEELGASVAILVDGQIIARGSIAELVAKHSTTAVELYFDGPPPELSLPYPTTVDVNVLRIQTDTPAETAAWVTGQLGPQLARLRGVDLIRPSLDSLYLTLTERRYSRVQQQVGPDGGYPLPIPPGRYEGPPAPAVFAGPGAPPQ